MKNFIIALFAIPAICFSQNLLQNPSFETWGGGMPDFWQKDDSILIFQEGTIVHSGAFSVKDSLFTQNQADADFYQTVPVSPNTQYNLSIWVWDNDPAGRIRMGVYWYPNGSNWSNVYSVDSPDWQLLGDTVISPADADSAMFMVRAYDVAANWDGGAVFYLDDAYFAPPPTQPPVIVRVWHSPTNPVPGVVEDVYAKVTDDGTIVADTLYYGINNLASPLKLSHSSVSNDTFNYQIPGQTLGDTIFYYLRFTDNDGLQAISDTHNYYVGEIGIYINEVYYDSPGTDTGCFIEVYGTPGMGLDGITLVGVNGLNGNPYKTIDLSGNSIPGDGFFVVAQDNSVANYDLVDPGANLQNGPDNLELRYNNITVDALGYGTPDGWYFTGEWLPADDVAAGHCLGRFPDGNDTDNNSVDFYDFDNLTPGETNPNSVSETKTTMPKKNITIANPITNNVTFSSLLSDKSLYPIAIYNALGQKVREISSPFSRLGLTTGIYFLQASNVEQTVKIVVVK